MAVVLGAKVTWTPSVSEDVVNQTLVWKLIRGGEVITEKSVNLTPVVSERQISQDLAGITILEGDVVEVTLTANDASSSSEPAVASAQVPLEPPMPVTDVVVEITSTPVVE